VVQRAEMQRVLQEMDDKPVLLADDTEYPHIHRGVHILTTQEAVARVVDEMLWVAGVAARSVILAHVVGDEPAQLSHRD